MPGGGQGGVADQKHRAARTMTDLLRMTLRLRPDRIIIGEVRGPEALAMLKAWNTGHPGGVATIRYPYPLVRWLSVPARGASCRLAAPALRTPGSM
jgi:hypothetical protein